MTDIIVKLPYIIISIIVGQACLGNLWVFSGCFYGAAGILLATGCWYILASLWKRTGMFHKLIGWAWCILPLQLFWGWVSSAAADAEGTFIIVIACMCIAGIFERLWIQDPLTEMDAHGLAGLLSLWIIGGAVTCCLIHFFPETVNGIVERIF